MTPGQEALIEAMRVEQARIYGHLLPDVSTPRPVPAVPVRETGQDSSVTDIRLVRKRKGAA